MNGCVHKRIRKKNYKPYVYCNYKKSIINKEECDYCEVKEYKQYKPIPNHKKKRTIATSIPKEVKEIVWDRDKHKCILCGKYVPIECACCHFIPRSSGGLGIEKNIFTACVECHREHDSGFNALKLQKITENYLKKYYGKNWNKDKLVYKKGV